MAADDPLVTALTDVAGTLERFAGRLEANEKADDELRQMVVRALEVASARNSMLDRIEEQYRRQADAAERAAVAAERQLEIQQAVEAERAATAAARWRAITTAVGSFLGSVLKHPITVALGGAVLLMIAQWVAAKVGINLLDFM